MKIRKLLLLIGVPIFLCFANSASAATYTWTGADGISWTNHLNWSPSSVPGPADNIEIRGDTGGTWPVVHAGIAANANGIWSGYSNTLGEPTVTVNTNGTLELTNYSIGFVGNARLIVNGGAVTVGSWGLNIGTGNEWGYGHGTINIYSGTIEAQILSFGTYTNGSMYAGGSGTINLFGGTISADSITQLDTPGCLINIEEGKLILDGDVRSQVDSWVAGGYMTAYNGSGAVERIYNSVYPNKTFVTALDNSKACGDPKWWDHFPRIVESGNLQVALDHHANIGMNGAQQDPGWGLYGQKVTENASRMTAFHNAGLKSIGYFETFGDSYCFIAELDNPSQSPEYNTVKCHYWFWQSYSGGEIIWIGVKNFWDDEVFARPWTRTHPIYNGPMMTYPDGNVATGYFGNDITDPRKNRTYDASTSKDILGDLTVFYGYATIPYTNGALYIPETDKWATFVGFMKDSACPLFADFTYASTHYACDRGLDGMWSDNYSPWDSFGDSPVDRAFGDWSVARFREFLSNNFSSSELTSMGVTDVTTFDVRDRLKTIATGWGWNGSSLNHPAWRNSGWQNEDIWQAYIIYKRQVGTEALTDYYNAVHDAANAAGTEDFLVQGNDIPINSLGWPRGNLDMVSTEISAGWNLCSGPRGFMMPPMGRFAPPYKYAREHAKSRFVNIWFYNGDYESYTDNTNLCWVLYSEMLANNTLPMFHPGNIKVIGTDDVNSDFFEFVSQVESNFGKRVPVEDIGIYYSSSSILNQMFPGGVKSFNAQPHQFANWGWATALGQLHYQYRAVPEWKLDLNMLTNLKVLIIPESEVFDDSDVAQILEPWVTNGGRLIVTGVSGRRHGESGNFDINSGGYSLEPLTTVPNISSAPAELLRTVGSGKVLYIKDNIGMNYFNASTIIARAALLSNFDSALNQVLGSNRDLTVLTPGTGVTSSVSLTVFEDPCTSNMFVDIVNFDIDLATDLMTDTDELKFTVKLPKWMQGPHETAVFSPTSTPPSVSISPVGPDSLEVTVGPVHHYASVKITRVIPEPIGPLHFFNFIFLVCYLKIK